MSIRYLVVQTVFEDLDVVNVAEVGAQLGQLLRIFCFLKKINLIIVDYGAYTKKNVSSQF